MNNLNRRTFLKTVGLATAETLVGPNVHLLAEEQAEAAKAVSPNDTIQFALIGAGIRGQGITRDCGPGSRSEVSGGLRLPTRAGATTARSCGDPASLPRVDYKEILARKDIDAVVIATPDHWHKQIAVDAMHAGKDVYCEKPMIHKYSDGPEMIEAARSTNRVIQIGSQRVSNVAYIKAKELLAAGSIGQLNMVTAWWDRNLQSAPGTIRCRWMLRLKPAIGRNFWEQPRRFLSTQSNFSSGVSGRPMVPASPVIFLFTYSAGRIL